MHVLLFIATALIFAVPFRAGDLLDQVVVTVNGNALLQSDWDDEVRYEAFMAGRLLSDVSASDRDSALNRIIDQELLREQMHGSDLKLATTADVDEQIATLKAQYEQGHPGLSWSKALASYGFSEAEFRERVQLQLDQLSLVDEKLRPSAEVDPAEVERYYKENIAPKNTAQPVTSFRDAEPKIRQILVQQKINQMLDSWLESLREQAKIQRFDLDSKTPGVKAQ